MKSRAPNSRATLAVLSTILLLSVPAAKAARQMENLGRSVIAINRGDGKVFVSWRMLGTDPDEIGFILYRSTGGEVPVKLSQEPITKSTSFTDNGAKLDQATTYFVRPVLKGREQQASAPCYLPAIATPAPRQRVP